MKNLQVLLVSIVTFVLSVGNGYAQDETKEYIAFDMYAHSTQKPFKSKKVYRYNLWELVENDCPLTFADIPLELGAAYDGLSFKSQGHLFNLVKGNVKISNQVISPTERQFLQSPFLVAGNSSKIFGCFTGMSYKEENFILNNVDYFSLIYEHIQYLQEELEYNYTSNGRTYNCVILQDTQEVKAVLNNRSQIGIMLSINGGHSLGNYLYIEQEQHRTLEYQNIILSNIKRLKGVLPIQESTQAYLEVPIFSMRFGNFYDDGVCGKVEQFSDIEKVSIPPQNSSGGGITALGQKMIPLLLDKKEGRRILVDVGDMSLPSRKWFYKYIKNQRFKKDSIPILATGVGISGISEKDEKYEIDGKYKNDNDVLSNRQANLSRQDIRAIINSYGLIGISLDKDRLMGKSIQTSYNATIKNSSNRRKIAAEAILANIFKVIHMSNTIDAWNCVSIGSQFDDYARHIDVFNNAGDMGELYQELYKFFKNPRPIPGLYSVKEVKKFMYNFTPKELADRILYKNALNFIMKHYPNIKRTEGP